VQLQSLQLKNFRTYPSLELRFDSRLTFLTGANANGKTNILEAVGLISLGKSFRSATDQDMARKASDAGPPGYFIGCRFRKGAENYELSYGCDLSGQTRRRIKINGKAVSGRQELIGHIITVIFSPDDILIAEGGPAYRRRFLDMVLSYQDQAYLKTLLAYNRALRQRNAILKRIKQQKARLGDLDAWNAGLIDLGGKLTAARQRFVEDFRSIFQDSLLRISGKRDELEMRLHYSSEIEAEDMAAALRKYAPRDAALGYTSGGPHRHNLMFEKNGEDILRFGSQGQKRSLVLALRIAQFFFLKKSLGLPPVLLIDDVIRELDVNRRGAFVQLLRECGQAIFTTPDFEGEERARLKDLENEITVYRVSAPGQVERA